MRARTLSRLAGMAVALAPLMAHAEDAPPQYPPCDGQPSETDVQGAKGAFQAGQASFEEGDYARAISYWEDAYRRDCTAHALLLNLARAYELNDHKLHAVNALETFLARNPGSNQRDQIARRIEGLKERIQQDSKPAQTGTPTQGDGDSSGVEVDPGPEQPAGPSRPITPLIVAGAGGVLTVVGGLLFLSARSDVKDIEDQCGGRACPTQALIDEGNDARSRQTTWGIVTLGGVAVTAGGLAWYFMSDSKSAEQTGLQLKKLPTKPRIDPVVGLGFTGVSVSGAF